MDLSMLFSSFFSVLINILSKLEICWFEGLVCSSSKVKQSRSGCLKALLCSPWRSLLAGHFETWKPWLHSKSLNSRLQKSSNCVERLAFVSAKNCSGNFLCYESLQTFRLHTSRVQLWSGMTISLRVFSLLCSDFMQNFQHSHNRNDHKW